MRFKIPDRQPDSFRLSARYMAGLTAGYSPDRVEWSFTLNLYTDTPDAAAAMMSATAARSTRCQAPIYHFVISFDPKDAEKGKIDARKMQEIAHDVIKRMGLKEYQGLVYAHNDEPHPHMHFLINRIHPVTGKALSRHDDGRRLTEICRDIARERGLNIPRDRNKEREKAKDLSREERLRVDDLNIPTEGEYWKAKRDGREADQSFSKERILELRKELRPLFDKAMDWEELDSMLRHKGYLLLPKGQGLIITDGIGYLKLSDLKSKDIRLPALNARFQERFQEWAAGQTELRIREEERDLPPPPKLDGLDKEARDRAKAIYKAKVDAAISRRDHKTARLDPVEALDLADSEYQHWLQLKENFAWSERTALQEQRRYEREAREPVLAEKQFAEEEAKLIESMAGVYHNVDKAHAEWKRLEAEKGSALALEAIAKKPKSLGAVHSHIWFSIGKDEKVAASHAIAKMVAQRRKWLQAKSRLDAARDRQITQKAALDKAVRDFQYLQQIAGSPDKLREILLRKIKVRAATLARVTPRMLERSKVAEDRLYHLRKAYRDFEERKRSRDRERFLERDLWDIER